MIKVIFVVHINSFIKLRLQILPMTGNNAHDSLLL